MPQTRKRQSAGAGFFDVFTPRNGYNNGSTATLQQYGDGIVTGITLSRAPIRKLLRGVVNLVTAGKFEDAVKRFGYDRLFHLSAIVDVDKDGVHKRVVVEKNAVINVSTSITNEPDAEFLSIPVNSSLTLRQLMDNGQAAMGAKWFPYDPFTNNCQHFIQGLLRANGLLTQAANEWLFQDMSEVQKHISGVSQTLMRGITRVGAIADRLLGRGMSDDEWLDLVIHTVLDELEAAQRKPVPRV